MQKFQQMLARFTNMCNSQRTHSEPGPPPCPTLPDSQQSLTEDELSSSYAPEAHRQNTVSPSSEVEKIIEACSYLTTGMLRELIKKDENVIFSPTSVQMALGILLAGAGGETAKQIMDAAFTAMDESETHDAMQVLLNILNAPKNGFDLHTANRLYGQTGFNVEETFVDMVAKYYGPSFKQVDFKGNPAAVAKEINAWVSEQTKEKVKNLVNEKLLRKDVKVLIVNAIYFKAMWEEQFDRYDTREADFELTPTTKVMCRMMDMTEYLPYFVDDHFRVLMLSYKSYLSDDLAMMFVLGKKRHSIKALINEGVPVSLQRLATNSAGNRTFIHCKVPKFKIETECSLKNVLQQIGIQKAFEQDADLSRMSAAGLYVSDVIHKAFIEVNEEGTEAAAATAITCVLTCGIIRPDDPPTEFFLDEPFVACIMRKGRVLFSAFVAKPE